MNDIQNQKPYTVDQVTNTKPNAPRTRNILSGYIANSMNGGHNRTIAWKKVMAGERHLEYRLKMNIQMLTPLTPTYQNLKCTVRAYFVPNSRVWKNAEKFTAQKGGATEIKIKKYPTLEGRVIPEIFDRDEDYTTSLMNTTLWRDSWISSYIPRLHEFKYVSAITGRELPDYNGLLLRGRIAIYNDYERNKEYDTQIYEYDGDDITPSEFLSYLPNTSGYKNDIATMRAKKDNSYYSDYRTEIQGFEDAYTNGQGSADSALITWQNWKAKIAEARSQAENAQANDWDIVSKIRGSKKLTEGKVQLIGQQTFNLNYAAITQNTYNNNESINEQFRVLGKQGAYSYTEVTLPMYAGMEFVEEGFVHFIACVSADTVYERALERTLMNTKWEDEYRPDMEGQKFDMLYRGEIDAHNLAKIKEAIGFKRKYSELFKLPNIIAGDMTSSNYFQLKQETTNGAMYFNPNSEVETQKTFQFFEQTADYVWNNDGLYAYKKIWKDYTDLMINKNLAIPEEVQDLYEVPEEGTSEIQVAGQNQIFFVGVHQCLAELPVNPEIAENYTKWGED